MPPPIKKLRPALHPIFRISPYHQPRLVIQRRILPIHPCLKRKIALSLQTEKVSIVRNVPVKRLLQKSVLPRLITTNLFPSRFTDFGSFIQDMRENKSPLSTCPKATAGSNNALPSAKPCCRNPRRAHRMIPPSFSVPSTITVP
jgi:hypothetical protein